MDISERSGLKFGLISEAAEILEPIFSKLKIEEQKTSPQNKEKGKEPERPKPPPQPTQKKRIARRTLSEIGTIWTINQQAKSLKLLSSTLAVVGKFRSV